MKLLKFILVLAFTLGIFISTPFSSKSAGACGVLPEGMTESMCEAITKLFEGQVDGPWYNQNPTQFAKKVTDRSNPDAIFGERYTFAQINWIVNSIATMLNPASGIDSPTKLFDFIKTINDTLGKLKSGIQPTMSDYAKLGPAGLFAGGINTLYSNPPASGVQEIKYTAERIFDLGTGTQTALAQSGGYGFSGLGGNSGSAVRALWTASRNMAYLIMTIILIASGFLIMFRVKINPQTVVTLQTMIPKLIITLLLVTFSFAIAGLVIDMIYVFIAFFVGMFSLGGIFDDPSQIGSTLKLLTDPGFGVYFWLQAPMQIIVVIILAIGLTIFTIAMFSTGVGGIGAGIVSAIILVILTIVLIYWFSKIFIMLIKSYVMIILQVIIGPLQIMLDLIPGQSGFGPWIRNIIANASVFVVVPVMLVIQHVISWDPITNWVLHIKAFGQGGFGGAELKLPYFDLLGGTGQGALGSFNFLTRFFIGFVIFSLTPKIADIIRDVLKVPAFKYGTGLGEMVGKPIETSVRSMTAVGKFFQKAGPKLSTGAVVEQRRAPEQG
jgi:hypothetical protein